MRHEANRRPENFEDGAGKFDPFPGGGDAFQHCEVIQQVDGGEFRVDAELLRQIAEDFADFGLLLEDIDAVERMAPESGSCRVATVRMRELLPAPFGPRRPNMLFPIVKETFFSARTPLG